MANENWEEINEWDIEEDIDLAKRITVHAVHSIDDEEEFQLIQAHKHPTYAAAAKWGSRKPSTSNSKETSKTNKTSAEKEKSSSTSPKDNNNSNKPTDAILKGDHDVDYDLPDSTSSKGWKETRRSNTKLHKTHSQKLMSTLISDAELECNQDLVKGDTNRDPEFKKYKLLKKTMALNKKLSEKSKNDRKSLRVEVW